MVGATWSDWTACSSSDKALTRQWLTDWRLLDNTSTAITTATGMVTGTIIINAAVAGPMAAGGPAAATTPNRRRAPLEFNPYINATELVIEFLAEARRLIPGLSRERFLRLTIADFFAFLIRRAAQADGVPPPEMAAQALPIPTLRHRCNGCGRFLPQRYELLRLYHCGAPCLERLAARNGICW